MRVGTKILNSGCELDSFYHQNKIRNSEIDKNLRVGPDLKIDIEGICVINKTMVFPIALITLAACLIVTSDTVLKKTMESLRMDEGDITNLRSIFRVILNPYIIFAFVLGGIAKLVYSFAISTHEISRMLAAMTVMIMIGYAIIGSCLFGETFSNFKALGLLLGLASVILLVGSK